MSKKNISDERNFIDSLSDFVDKNSKHGFEIVMMSLANIVTIFLIFLNLDNQIMIWAIFLFVVIEVIIASLIYYKKEILKLKK